MKKQNVEELAIYVTEMMAKRKKESMLTLAAQMCIEKNDHIGYLKMMWEQSHQATEQVKKVLGVRIFNQVYFLTEKDFN